MRRLIATLAAVTLLAAAYIAQPWLQARGLPTGGLLMLGVAALLAWSWMAITGRGKDPE